MCFVYRLKIFVLSVSSLQSLTLGTSALLWLSKHHSPLSIYLVVMKIIIFLMDAVAVWMSSSMVVVHGKQGRARQSQTDVSSGCRDGPSIGMDVIMMVNVLSLASHTMQWQWPSVAFVFHIHCDPSQPLGKTFTSCTVLVEGRMMLEWWPSFVTFSPATLAHQSCSQKIIGRTFLSCVQVRHSSSMILWLQDMHVSQISSLKAGEHSGEGIWLLFIIPLVRCGWFESW